jgi:uncharacterized membrane protein YgcG
MYTLKRGYTPTVGSPMTIEDNIYYGMPAMIRLRYQEVANRPSVMTDDDDISSSILGMAVADAIIDYDTPSFDSTPDTTPSDTPSFDGFDGGSFGGGGSDGTW